MIYNTYNIITYTNNIYNKCKITIIDNYVSVKKKNHFVTSVFKNKDFN